MCRLVAAKPHRVGAPEPAKHVRTCLAGVQEYTKASTTMMETCPRAPGCGDVSGEVLVECVARALRCVVKHEKGPSDKPTPFDSSSVPAVPLKEYLGRLHREFRCSPSVLVCALALLDRVLQSRESVAERLDVTAWSVHRLFLACAVLAAKYNEDRNWRNGTYADIGGVGTRELNRLERICFRRLAFDVDVAPGLYEDYRRGVALLADGRVVLPADPAAAAGEAATKLFSLRSCFVGLSAVPPCCLPALFLCSSALIRAPGGSGDPGRGPGGAKSAEAARPAAPVEEDTAV